MIDNIRIQSQEIFPILQEIRHHIHAHPELSFQEYETSKYVASWLEKWGIEVQKNVAGTGMVGLIKGKNPDNICVGIRSELDALPIQEANEVSYKSQNDGVMHACGHDVHTTCLLGVAKILNDTKNEWEGTVKLIIQPGEEKHPGGASLMIKDGALNNPRPASLFALHVYPHLLSGTVGFRGGQYMASADEIYITIEGRGGHAALPHQTIDPIAISALVITGLQQVISRKGNPLIPSVLTFGKIEGGFATNVIPDKVEILGTLRTMDETWRYEAHQLIKDFTEKTCEAYGAKAKVEIPKGYPSLFNDENLTTFAHKKAEEYLGKEKVKTLNLRMAAEDFSFYTHEVPGCFFRIGTNLNEEQFIAPVHNSHFDIDENAMVTAVGTMAYLVRNALTKKD